MLSSDARRTSVDLSVLVVRRQLSKVFGGPHHGTEYSMERACPRCGTGAEQVGPLRLNRFSLPTAAVFLTLDHEVLMRMTLGETLRASGVTCLGDVIDARSGDRLDVLQLRSEATLPPFAPQTTGVTRERPCPACARDGHYGIPHVRYGLQYDTLDGELQSTNVFATYERFGTSVLRQPFRDSVFAAPLFVVSGRVAAALRAANLEYVELHRVEIAGDNRHEDRVG
jgi:hypothetical protein